MTITRRQGWRRWASGAMLAPLLLGFGAGPASAQFSWFGLREASPQDVSDTITDHGFRLVGPLYRNGRVYLADVIDRRQRRERLVISAESGEIVQRYFVDVGPERRAPVVAPRSAPRDDSFFSNLTRGWDDEAPPRPPVGLTNRDDGLPPPNAPPLARPRPLPQAQPRIVTREPGPVTASPLPPSTAAAPAQTSKPEVVTVPTAPSTVRGTSVSSDPLRIPGTRKAEEARERQPAAPTSVAKAADKPAGEPASAPAQAKSKPAPTSHVPVAPLD